MPILIRPIQYYTDKLDKFSLIQTIRLYRYVTRTNVPFFDH